MHRVEHGDHRIDPKIGSPVTIHCFRLKDQVILNSDIDSPFTFLPVETAVKVTDSPVLTVSSIAARIDSPSSQVNDTTDVPFLKKSPSIRITSMETAGFRPWRCAMANIPVLNSAAIAWQAK